MEEEGKLPPGRPVRRSLADLVSWERGQPEKIRQQAVDHGLRGGGPVNPNRRSRRPRPPNASAKGIDHDPKPEGGFV